MTPHGPSSRDDLMWGAAYGAAMSVPFFIFAPVDPTLALVAVPTVVIVCALISVAARAVHERFF